MWSAGRIPSALTCIAHHFSPLCIKHQLNISDPDMSLHHATQLYLKWKLWFVLFLFIHSRVCLYGNFGYYFSQVVHVVAVCNVSVRSLKINSFHHLFPFQLAQSLSKPGLSAGWVLYFGEFNDSFLLNLIQINWNYPELLWILKQ